VLKYIKAMVAKKSSEFYDAGNMLTNVNVMLVSTIAQIARPMNPTLLKISHFFIKGGSKNKKINYGPKPNKQ